MHNLVYCIGRLTNDPVLENIEGKEKLNLTLAVPRSYKNDEGIYDTDFIDLVLYNAIAKHTNEYCKKGDLVGIKGTLQTNNIYNEDGSITKKVMEVVVEKISFLTSNTKDIKQDDNIVVNID